VLCDGLVVTLCGAEVYERTQFRPGRIQVLYIMIARFRSAFKHIVVGVVQKRKAKAS
jgi:hypothetical protein